MRAQDPVLYAEVEKSLVASGVKATKPVFIHEFVPKLHAKSPNSLDTTIRPLLDYAFDVRARVNGRSIHDSLAMSVFCIRL